MFDNQAALPRLWAPGPRSICRSDGHPIGGLLLALVAMFLAGPLTWRLDAAPRDPQRPNVVVILADDVGFGDLGCYGATQVRTPNLDRLASQGRRFTDAHSPASVCTPTRAALLTGRYSWRQPAGAGILSGEAPLCIATSQLTLPKIFKSAGYATAAVGKWHLGLGGDGNTKSDAKTDFNAPIQPGPLEIGFDYFFGVPATGDRVPCVYVENHGVVGFDPADPIAVSYAGPIGNEPTGKDHPELLKVHPSHGHDNTIVNGISRIGYMTGGHAARWVDEDMADVLTRKAVGFIEAHRDEPFFLYFCTHDVHVPRVPHPRFAGHSPCGTRGDVIEELDSCVGEVLSALDRLGLADDTLIVFTSDNGGVVDDGYQDGAASDTSGHRPNGALRGRKGTLFEGGHRVPFIVRWPGHVQIGQSDQLICHVDPAATSAALLNQKLPEEAAVDSFNLLPAFEGGSQPVREHLVHHTGGFPGSLAIRQGSWKLIDAAADGYTQKPDRKPMLFNLADDPAEEDDLAAAQPQRVAELRERLAALRKDGRSRP